MEHTVTTFFRDYSKPKKSRSQNASADESSHLFDALCDRNILKRCQDALNAIPKVVLSDRKAIYDDLLSRFDSYAMLQGGKIRGVVNYENGDAWIEGIIPFFGATSDETRQLFADIIQSSITMNFTATDDGNVRLYALLPYFEDLCDDETRDELLMQELMKHPDIIDVMENQIAREYTTIERMLQSEFFRQKIGLADEIVTGESAEDFIQILKQEAKKDPLGFLTLLEQIGISLDEMLSGESFPVC